MQALSYCPSIVQSSLRIIEIQMRGKFLQACWSSFKSLKWAVLSKHYSSPNLKQTSTVLPKLINWGGLEKTALVPQDRLLTMRKNQPSDAILEYPCDIFLKFWRM